MHSTKFLNHKEVGNNAKSSQRKESRDHHSKLSKGDRDRQVSPEVTSRCNLKVDTNKVLYQET